ncbi:hypothetical protein [Aliarcobacter butzleri]|uniref:hypothetical protein n=1 Tax=Aliarcobacter butzleri TaxID=28197 RepID=UPI003AFB493B
MLKINYAKKFDRNKYFKDISEKYFYISKNELLKVNIKNHSKSTITLEEIFNYFKTNKIGEFDTIFENISLKCLTIGNFKTLQKIKNQISQKDNEFIKFLFDYTDLQSSKIAPFFENNLEISTCYYCNIDYVNTYNTKKEEK